MHVVSAQLEWLGLTHQHNYLRALRRIAGAASSEEFNALRTLADVVEPVKDYTREQTADGAGYERYAIESGGGCDTAGEPSGAGVQRNGG